ncbi:MAG TPA: nucleoside-diphosphate-sugar pyrophosphorylase [Candidatus Omnitrophica bacterium]|nr:MAG: hypothetical protein A2Z81_07680 [Omnitrophica WOR_2 bacterium GWA2_45_18]HBR15154.1 nucleoside-diphosphate-sugar pyrophosphorylase [Candidatus Omnitrophota bacterium]
MKALILAAGYGTRLYALGENTPKALLPIQDKPLVNYILDKIEKLPGLDEVLLVTNNKFYPVFEDWAKKLRESIQGGAGPGKPSFSLPVRVVNDGTNTPEERLGSIGDIDFVLRQTSLNDDLLVVGGDNLFDYKLDEYIVFAKERSPAVTIGLYDIKNREEAKKFGVVDLDPRKRIVSFQEKPALPKTTLIAMCFYYFPKKSLGLVSAYLSETVKSDAAGDYIRWLHQENPVYGFQFTGKWYDIGSLEAYQEAQENFIRRGSAR